MGGSIKKKLSAFFLVCLAFVGVLTFFYFESMFQLESRLFTIEKFDDLRSNILEMRRYEKNYLLYQKQIDLVELDSYLRRADEMFKNLADDIRSAVGEKEFQSLRQALRDYKESLQMTVLLTSQDQLASGQLAQLRTRGKRLVDSVRSLIHQEREYVRRALKGLITIPLVLVGVFVLVVVLIFRVVAVRILKPLDLIQEATDKVARDTFTPIAYKSSHKDEVTHLIAAFNKMAEELESRQAQLLQSRKMASLGTLTSGVAHELNNPLNNISLTAETLLMDYKDLPDQEMEDLLKEIMEQAERGSHVVKNLLEFSRTNRGGGQLSPIKPRELIEGTLKLVKNQLLVSGIELETHYDEGLPLLKGKRHDLEQALLNILVNAIQAMPGGGRITVRASRTDEMVCLEIADTGVGIKQEDLNHIFDPFFTTKPVGQGTGLGLSLTYGIIRSHGGHIEVKGAEGKGTTFSIYLPIAQEQQEAEQAHGA